MYTTFSRQSVDIVIRPSCLPNIVMSSLSDIGMVMNFDVRSGAGGSSSPTTAAGSSNSTGFSEDEVDTDTATVETSVDELGYSAGPLESSADEPLYVFSSAASLFVVLSTYFF